jgi:hypothetical protein
MRRRAILGPLSGRHDHELRHDAVPVDGIKPSSAHRRFPPILLPPAVVADANVVLSARIEVFTTGDLLDALRDAGHDPDLA